LRPVKLSEEIGDKDVRVWLRLAWVLVVDQLG
jgi:hypothetical protein